MITNRCMPDRLTILHLQQMPLNYTPLSDVKLQGLNGGKG